tara:strand:- start:628 stop:1524 length:897 start_codon:yes stop_codon:yes gene_type:complete
MNNKTNKVVVFGGSGFIGSHTADELSNRGYNVVIYDCLISKYLKKNQKFVHGNLSDNFLIEKTLYDAEYVYYFAGIADIEESKKNPNKTIEVNILGLNNVLNEISKINLNRFVYASTMYVYSSYGSFYRASKQCAEIIIKTYCEEFNFDYTFLRYGSLYGSRAQEWNGLKKYIQEIINEKKIDYIGTGTERREYIHAIDASKISVDVLNDSFKNTAITVTGQQILTSEVLINMIFEITGIKKNINFIEKEKKSDHYNITPYRYIPENSMKIVPDRFIDIGEGILEIVKKIYSENIKMS